MKIVLVQGINGNVGTSSVSAALAHSCTLIDKKSLVVDANLKKAEPQLATFFNLEKDSFGWSDALLQQTFDKNAPSFVLLNAFRKSSGLRFIKVKCYR